MHILLFGKDGQVGASLQRRLSPYVKLTALGRSDSSYCGDLSNLSGISATVGNLRPDFIINAAAYTAVDRAETEAAIAARINSEAPAALARAAKAAGAWLVHFSTDYVFDGSGDKFWNESDPPGPINVYGRTKLAGEEAISSVHANHIILRTSWVYAPFRNNFVTSILRQATEKPELNIVDDQIGAPTSADLVADVTYQAITAARRRPDSAGLYHLAAAGTVSRHGCATYIVDQAAQLGFSLQARPDTIKATKSAEYQTAARRPMNSRLDTGKLRETFNIALPDWKLGITALLKQTMSRPTAGSR